MKRKGSRGRPRGEGGSKAPRWLTLEIVRALHASLLAEHGGLNGLRDAGLLESALSRPRNLAAYGTPGLPELAAAYAFGLCRNHPFLDGNKRVTLAALDVFLRLNGRALEVPEPEAVAAILDLAGGTLSEADLGKWIAGHCIPLRRA